MMEEKNVVWKEEDVKGKDKVRGYPTDFVPKIKIFEILNFLVKT